MHDAHPTLLSANGSGLGCVQRSIAAHNTKLVPNRFYCVSFFFLLLLLVFALFLLVFVRRVRMRARSFNNYSCSLSSIVGRSDGIAVCAERKRNCTQVNEINLFCHAILNEGNDEHRWKKGNGKKQLKIKCHLPDTSDTSHIRVKLRDRRDRKW